MCYGNAGSSNNTAMLINSSGNVTIGASDLASTNYKLYVDGSTKIAGTIYDVNNIYPNSAGEKYIGTSTNPFKYMYAEWFGAGTGQTLSFGANNATHIWVNTSGNVGIGTVNPSEKLHVNGSGIFGASTETKIRLNNGNIGIAGNTYQRIIGGYSNDYSSVLGGLNIYVASNALQLLWLGTNSERWLSADARYSTLEADWRLWANAGLTIPTGQTLKIGDATLSWDSTANALKINKDFYSDGQVSSGGVAEEGTGGAVGGGSLDRVVFTIPAQTTSFTCEHNLGTREISVTIYEEGNDYQQVLADVYLDSTNIARVVFGSATDVAHKVVIIG